MKSLNKIFMTNYIEQDIPKELLDTKYRKELLKKLQKTIKKLEKVLPISSIYLLGSFTTAKRRPQDIDIIVLLKTKSKNKNEEWSIDFQLVPDNKYGGWMLSECKKWMKYKYGLKKSAVIKLK